MNLLSLIPSWVWAAAVAALTTVSCKLTVDLGAVKLELEKSKVAMAEQEAAYESSRANAATVLAEAQARAREAEQSIQTTANAIREETHAQVLAANAAADALRERLRVARSEQEPRPFVSALMPSAPKVTSAATRPVVAGAVLPDGLGDELVSLALRAEEIRADAQACRRQYEAARAQIEAMEVRPSAAAQDGVAPAAD